MKLKKTKRVLTNLESPLYLFVLESARKDHISISQKVRDLIKKALILEEDMVLEALVHGRKRTQKRSISHQNFWRQRKIK